MKRGRAIGIVVACLVCGLVVAASTGADAHNLMGGGKWFDSPLGKLIVGNLGRWMVAHSELDLSAEQKVQIQATLVLHRPEIARAARGVWEKREVLRKAVLAEKPDEAAIRRASDDVGKAVGDAAVLASKVVGELRPILTEQQRKIIQKTQAECSESVEKFFDKILGK